MENVLRTFYVAGVQHHQMRLVLHKLELDMRLQLRMEPTNKFDPNAIRVEFESEDDGVVMCGYVPKKFSSEISAAIITQTEPIECVIVELNKDAKPWIWCKVEIRLLSDK